ncbi:MAG: MFS transporter [Gemmatimonadaceae bacterium]|nr:MFS transporter [Gemmatimonadaceae bacterium]
MLVEGKGAAARWRILALLSLAVLLGMSVWFAANAVSAQIAARFELDSSQVGWLTTIVQLGFVIGTAAIAMLNLADIIPSRLLFAFSAFMGAAANLTLLIAPTFATILLARFATGIFLAGVYPPAMKMISTWFVSQRGLAIGAIVGALTIGKATPFLIHSIPQVDVNAVIAIASAFAVSGALLVLAGYSDGPHAFVPRPFSWQLAGTVFGSRKWRLATASYLGHMFELYAFWTWIGAFLAASMVATTARISLLTFVIIATGGIGCVWGGVYADRNGRERLVRIALLVSGACCVASVFLFGQRMILVIPFALIWGFFVIADSAQFSALVTESVESHAVGTALTLQTSLGFLLTMLPMQLVPRFASAFGWRFALIFLALGPAAGIIAIGRLARRSG